MKDHNKYITVITTREPCGKSAELDAAGNIQFKSNGDVIEGTARAVEVKTPQALLEVLDGLSERDFVSPDYIPEMIGMEKCWMMQRWRYKQFTNGETTGKPFLCEDPRLGGIPAVAQTNNGTWKFGGWRILDRDVDEITPEKFRCSHEEWLEYADQLLPGVKDAPRVFWPSSKGRVANAEGKAKESLNGHLWVDCSAGGTDETNIYRGEFKLRAHRLNLAWYLSDRQNKNGVKLKPLLRTVFDHSVWSIHRNIYAGKPTVGAGLKLLPHKGFAVDGAPIDLRDAINLSTSKELKNYASDVGVKVARVEDGRLSEWEQGLLNLNSKVDIQHTDAPNGVTSMTLRAFFESDAFDFSDSEDEEVGKYRSQTILRDSSSWNGILRKFRNGMIWQHDNGNGVTHKIVEPHVMAVAAAFAKDPTDINAESNLGKALAMMSNARFSAMAGDIKAATGLPDKKTLEAMRKSFAGYTVEGAQVKAGRAEFLETDVKRRAARKAAQITEIDDGDECLAELLAHWFLFVGKRATTLATFATENSRPGYHSLEFKEFAPQSLRDFFKAFPTSDDRNPVDAYMASDQRIGADKICFEPGLPRYRDGALNLWTGFDIDPYEGDADSECRLFLQHVKEVLANGDEEIGDYIIKWLATRVQGIANRNGAFVLPRMIVAIVMRATQGAGKSTFGKYLTRIFGNHALVTQRGEALVGQFNSQFANLALLIAEEAFFAGDHKAQDALKSFLTEERFTFEQKFLDAQSVSNHVAMMMFSNKDFVVPADIDDRRMCVIDVSTKRIGDSAYFSALHKELEGNGPSALLRYLLDVDLSDFNINDFPRTEAMRDQKAMTQNRDNPVFRFISEMLENGEFQIPKQTGIIRLESRVLGRKERTQDTATPNR